MKLHSDSTQQYQTVTGYDASGRGNQCPAFRLQPDRDAGDAAAPWEVSRFEDLQAAHFEQIAADAPDVVILGTGERQRFVHPRLIASLSARHIGVESMDSQAACRTYNVLMGEGRKVTLALIIEGSTGGAFRPEKLALLKVAFRPHIGATIDISACCAGIGCPIMMSGSGCESDPALTSIQENPVAVSPSAATVANFSAAMTGDQTFQLGRRPAKYTVLYFYPKDNTPGCTTESMAFRDLHDAIPGRRRRSLRHQPRFAALARRLQIQARPAFRTDLRSGRTRVQPVRRHENEE
jgi:hypothetical protein